MTSPAAPYVREARISCRRQGGEKSHSLNRAHLEKSIRRNTPRCDVLASLAKLPQLKGGSPGSSFTFVCKDAADGLSSSDVTRFAAFVIKARLVTLVFQQ